MRTLFGGVFQGLKVLVTGHTGFKGSWLIVWLRELGADVIGYSLEELPTFPCNFQLSQLKNKIVDERGDIRDLNKLYDIIKKYQPQLVFHLAAQPIVRTSYMEPKETFDINVAGTVNILEAIRKTECVKALVCITTDKCYENKEWVWGYRENDRLGGNDPYSASKAMAELAIASYRKSFFSNPSKQKVAIASTRAGNVIGGGDWAKDRLVVDCMKALMENSVIEVRSPKSVRPWQHVLEPLSGYLVLAQRLLQQGDKYADAWNFGPLEYAGVSAEELVKKTIELWGKGNWKDVSSNRNLPETKILRLSWEKAAKYLNWHPHYTWEKALSETVDWFLKYYNQSFNSTTLDMYNVCVEQIKKYVDHSI